MHKLRAAPFKKEFLQGFLALRANFLKRQWKKHAPLLYPLLYVIYAWLLTYKFV